MSWQPKLDRLLAIKSFNDVRTSDLTGLEGGLRDVLNKGLLGPLPAEQYMENRFNPTLMQGVNLVKEVIPGIGDIKAAQDTRTSWNAGNTLMSALNAASIVPGVGALARIGGNAAIPLMTAFHGTPHRFSKFDMSKIGTGEGAQAYGHGLYFAESEGVAKSYQMQLQPFLADVAVEFGLPKPTPGFAVTGYICPLKLLF